MREILYSPGRAFRSLFERLTGKERAILALLAASLLWGASAAVLEVVRNPADRRGQPPSLYRELRAALPDRGFVPGGAEPEAGAPETPRGPVSLTRPPLPGEQEVEVSEDGWIFFPRDYYTTVNINTAGLDELVSLPGIGPVIAWRIIRYRERYVGFSRVKALKRIRGIGDRTLERLEGRIRLY